MVRSSPPSRLADNTCDTVRLLPTFLPTIDGSKFSNRNNSVCSILAILGSPFCWLNGVIVLCFRGVKRFLSPARRDYLSPQHCSPMRRAPYAVDDTCMVSCAGLKRDLSQRHMGIVLCHV